MSLNILIVGVGGLGTCMMQEALERGMNVSVLVRNREKFERSVGGAVLSKLSKINVGDGTQAKVLEEAMRGIDVVLSGRGAAPDLALALSQAVKRNGIKKLCWPSGTTNVMAEDGLTPNYQKLLHLGGWVAHAYAVHGECIDIIQKADINYVIFCPGRMDSMGQRSPNVKATIKINRDAGPFVSYEDAAWVMVEAAATNTYDRQLVSAATQG